MTYKRKYNYWHRIVDAHEDKKKQLCEELDMSWDKIVADILWSATRPYKDERMVLMNVRSGEESWMDLDYVGRAKKGIEPEKLMKELGLEVDS